jgi:hypothetical protein
VKADPTAWVVPVAFLGGGLLSGWVGYGRWDGLLWATLSWFAAFVLGAQYARWQDRRDHATDR